MQKRVVIFEKEFLLTVGLIPEAYGEAGQYIRECIRKECFVEVENVVKLVMKFDEIEVKNPKNPEEKRMAKVTNFEPIEFTNKFKFGRTWINPKAYDLISLPDKNSNISRGFRASILEVPLEPNPEEARMTPSGIVAPCAEDRQNLTNTNGAIPAVPPRSSIL